MGQATLPTYRLQVARLLHDSNNRFYSVADLNDYINAARLRVCGDTGCLRQLQPFTLTPSQEVYLFTSLPNPGNVIDLWNVTVIFGQTRYVMLKMSFSDLNAKVRPYKVYSAMPVAWANYGESSWIMAPMPDQAYPAEIDTIMYGGDLLSDSQPETIPLVFQECVKYYAAREAKQNSQDWAEADRFEGMYRKSIMGVRASRSLRSIPNAYQIGLR
jgi:hypothetical protein